MRLNLGKVSVELIPDGAVKAVELPDLKLSAVPCTVKVQGLVEGRVAYDTRHAGQRGSRSLTVKGLVQGDITILDEGRGDSVSAQQIEIEGSFCRSLEVILREECTMGGVHVRINSAASLGILVNARRDSNGESLHTDVIYDSNLIQILVGSFVPASAAV